MTATVLYIEDQDDNIVLVQRILKQRPPYPDRGRCYSASERLAAAAATHLTVHQEGASSPATESR
jgi:hypothetical protein